MSNVRDSDTSLWLHNKLGTSNDSWSGGSICSQLNREVLRNIKECFPDLQTQVKLKLLLSFFHIPKKNVDEWRGDLEEILEVAQMDSEQWVSMLGELMKTYPTTGNLNTEISGDVEENRRIYTDLITDLRKLVKKQTDTGMLPLECHYLNKAVLNGFIGNLPTPTKHFQLRRKPKSAALRSDLLQKSVDAAANVKKTAAMTIPLRSRGMPRKMTDTTPLKGIPSRVPTGGFRPPGTAVSSRPGIIRPPAGRKDGGIKLLDITEQPLGFAAAKKRKRMQEVEEASKKAAIEAEKAANTTPDYAAGLAPSNPPTPAPAASTPAPPAPAATFPTPVPGTPVAASSSLPSSESLLLPSPATPKLGANYILSNPVSVLGRQALVLTPTAPNTPVSSKTAVARLVAAAPAAAPSASVATKVIQVAQPAAIQPTPAPVRPPVQQIIVPSAPPAAAAASPVTTTVVTAPVKKGLSLTREQMLEAQSMFKTANKITRAEKALILGFMAGSRENPCPHLGSIITIKLSENPEEVMQNEQCVSMVAETHFQMNYNTGEWKRMKKFRKPDEIPNTQIVVTQQAAASATPQVPA